MEKHGHLPDRLKFIQLESTVQFLLNQPIRHLRALHPNLHIHDSTRGLLLLMCALTKLIFHRCVAMAKNIH